MSIQSILREIKAVSGVPFPRTEFLTIFFGVVVLPSVMFAIGGHPANITGQPALLWSFMTIAVLVLGGISLGFWMFTQDAKRVSIRPTDAGDKLSLTGHANVEAKRNRQSSSTATGE